MITWSFQTPQRLKHVFLFRRSVRLFATLWTAACQTSLSFTVSQSLLKLMSTELVMPSNHLILHCPLLLLPSIFPSIRGFSSESALCIRWPKYWNFSFIINPSSEYSGLISFTINWFDLLAAQGTLKSLLQHTIQNHQFFGAQSSLRSNFNIGQYKVINYKRIYVLFCPSLFFSHHHRHSQDCDRQPLWSLSSLLISHLSRKNAHREIMYLL